MIARSETFPSSSRWKRWVLGGMKLGLTALLLGLAFRGVTLASLRAALLQVEPVSALLSCLCFVALIIPVEAARLHFSAALLRERQPGLRTWLRLYLGTRPFFYLLPGGMGSEGVLWMRLRQLEWRHVSCGLVTLLTRLMGVGVWGIGAAWAVGFPGARELLSSAPHWVRGPLWWCMGGTLALVLSALLPFLFRGLRGLELSAHLPRSYLAMLLLSLASMGVNAAAVWWASRSALVPFPVDMAVGLMAFFNFAMVLPISLAGFGIQEALVLSLGLPLGYAASALLAFSTVIHVQRLSLVLVGLPFLGDRAQSLDDVPQESLLQEKGPNQWR